MRILVTGATGFIGNYVVNELLRLGHGVIASSADREKAKTATWFNKVLYIPLDLGSFDDRVDHFVFFQKPDLLIHLAWEDLPNYKSPVHLETNFPRHFLFLKNMIRNGLNDLTVTGTCFEYGMQEGELSEDMEARPDNFYGLAKNELRIALEKLLDAYRFSLKWVRLFYMYGKGQNPKSLLSQLETALENGETLFNMSGGQQVRDFLPVEKVAENLVKIALQKAVVGIINNCSGVGITVQAFVEEWLRRNNKNIQLNLGHYPYPDYEPMRFWGNADKLKKITNHE